LTETLRVARSKLGKASTQLPYLPRALALVWAASHRWTTAWAATLAVQGLLPAASVLLTRAVVNALLAVIRGDGSLRALLIPAGLLAAVLLVTELLRGLLGWLRAVQAELVEDHIRGLIHQKSIAADLAFYESPEFHDHLHRAREEAGYRPITLLETLGALFENGITAAAMLAVLIPFGAWLPFALIASTVPALWVVLHYAALQHRFRQSATAEERRAGYYDWLLTSSETAAELRLFGLGGHFRAAYQIVRGNLRRERLKLARGEAAAELAASSLALATSGGAVAWMAWRTIQGLLTPGDLALFVQAFQQGLRVMRGLLEGTGRLYQNSLFLGNLFAFLELQPTIVSSAEPGVPPLTLGRDLTFRDVTFLYPGSSRVALRDFNITIPAGQMVAIVGPNGAGKSTLVKLLCRFYDPHAGQVEWDGSDLRTLPVENLRSAISVLFQHPVHYNATAEENIRLGDLTRRDSRAIQEAATGAGASEIIAQLPQGFQTLLGKWFENGAELSTGEWQRLALARAFLRKASLLILDEPTSSMDPWAEADWLTRFRQLAAGRTAILITHRFTTAMFADVIHVMHDGQVVESGTHDELLARGGLYARGWRSRAVVELTS